MDQLGECVKHLQRNNCCTQSLPSSHIQDYKLCIVIICMYVCIWCPVRTNRAHTCCVWALFVSTAALNMCWQQSARVCVCVCVCACVRACVCVCAYMERDTTSCALCACPSPSVRCVPQDVDLSRGAPQG